VLVCDSMEVASHQYSLNGFFHNYGVDSMDTYAARGKWKLRRMATIMKELGHADVSTEKKCVGLN
jgi:hypothetical protein